MSWIRDGRNEPDGRSRNRFRHPNRGAPPDRSEGRGNRELGSRRDDRRCLRTCGAIARCRNWVTRVEIDESRARNAETKTQLSPKNEYAAVSSRRGRRDRVKSRCEKRAMVPMSPYRKHPERPAVTGKKERAVSHWNRRSFDSICTRVARKRLSKREWRQQPWSGRPRGLLPEAPSRVGARRGPGFE